MFKREKGENDNLHLLNSKALSTSNDKINTDHNQLLDFLKQNGKDVKLPNWFQFPEDGVSVICGAGDYVRIVEGHWQTNVELFRDYDIFICIGEDEIAPKGKQSDIYSSVEENLKWLKANEPNKLLYLMDMGNEKQVSKFLEIFYNSIKKYHHIQTVLFLIH